MILLTSLFLNVLLVSIYRGTDSIMCSIKYLIARMLYLFLLHIYSYRLKTSGGINNLPRYSIYIFCNSDAPICTSVSLCRLSGRPIAGTLIFKVFVQ